MSTPGGWRSAPPAEHLGGRSRRTKMTKLLLVEDDDAIREMMRRRLELRGFAVAQASDGESAVRMALESPPGAMLLDMELPGMNGYEVARLLRSDPRCAGVRIFALTAHVTPAERDRALEAGCDGFFSKPIDF